MKKVLSLLFGYLLLFPAAYADEASWLTFRLADDSEISVAAENLSITYGDGKLHILGSSVNQELTVAQVRSMQFTSSPAALVELKSTDSEAENLYYNTSGVLVGSFKSVDEAKKMLAHGVYIVKSGQKSIKIIF